MDQKQVKKSYHFDRIRINTRQYIKDLSKIPPWKELKKHCKEYYLMKASRQAKKAGFQSSINVILPDNEFFKRLDEVQNDIGYYKISHLEITEDTFKKTERQAEKAFREIYKTANKKWSSAHKLFQGEFVQVQIDGKWYDQTLYMGSYAFKCVIYPRLSKANGQPCLHKEFILKGAGNIKKRTGIEFIRDLIDYDIERNYKKLENKFIDHTEIDMLKLGKFLDDKTRKRKIADEEERKLKTKARLFLKSIGSRQYPTDPRKGKTYADLKNWLSSQKKIIKSHRGRRSKWEERILKVQYGYFKK
jgi:hypothetical protein